MQIKHFLEKFLPSAEAVENRYGISRFLILAQAALESAWGDHAPGNNFFGIKATDNWKGEVQELPTFEFEDGVKVKKLQKFRKYINPEHSFADHAEVLKKVYPKVINAEPQAAAKALISGKKKYATDPLYDVKLIKIIEKLKKEIPMPNKITLAEEAAEVKIIARGPDNIPHKAVLNFDMVPVKLPAKPGEDLIGTEELHEVIDFGVAFGNALIKTFEDGKITIGDIPQFVSPMFKLPSAINGLDKVPAEINDLTEQELQAEIDFIMQTLDVDNEHARNIIVAAINAVYSNYLLVKAIKG